MKKIVCIPIFIVLAPGCSYIESFFPDKERDYQYTSETPLLTWPSGLRQNLPDNKTNDPAVSEPNAGDSVADQPPLTPASPDDSPTQASADDGDSPPSESNTTEVTQADASDEQETAASVEVVKYDDGESRLRLGARFSKSWRLVNKALTRNTIEVTERNYENGAVRFFYDPDEKKAKDDTFMDEIDFIFKGININDKEYNLKFEEHGQQTDVIVLDEEHLPLLNDDKVLRFLKRIADTIKADLNKKTP